MESLRGNRSLHAALSLITAAVVGAILNLSIWFGLHVVFHEITEVHFGIARAFVPALQSIDIASTTLAALAMLAIFRFKLGVPKTLFACALAGIAFRFVFAPR